MSYSDEVPEHINGDPTRVRQILVNLIGNALKFTPHGSVELLIEKAPGATPLIRVSVKDTGIGISDSVIKRLFGQFSQADASTSRKYSGSGLGLSICKRLVELLGGQIGVQSEEGVGSTFWFTFPLEEAKTKGTNIVSETQALSYSTHRSLDILVAEDNPTNQLLIRFILEKLGHNPTIVNNGIEAVETDATGDFDLILMDIRMPEMDGITATQRIRASEKGQSRPIIAISADAMKDNVSSYLDAGMDGYVAKPINRALLVEAINKTLGEEIHSLG